MAINNRTDITVVNYSRSQRPLVQDDSIKYFIDELQRVQTSIDSLTNASIQVADRAPETPQRGMVRYNIAPWYPIGGTSQGLVVYNGTAWVAV